MPPFPHAHHLVIRSPRARMVEAPSGYLVGLITEEVAWFDFATKGAAERGADEIRQQGWPVEVRPGRHPVPDKGEAR